MRVWGCRSFLVKQSIQTKKTEMLQQHKLSPPFSEIDLAPSVDVVGFTESLSKWNLVESYLRLRKEVFVEKMKWPLFHSEGIEFEQYDTLDTIYVIARRGSQVVGGARLRRADQTSGKGSVVYSYMIRDAYLGILPGLPREIVPEEPPNTADCWELTRFAVIRDTELVIMMLRKINDFLYKHGAKKCLCLGSPAFLRVARRVGWTVTPLGPVVCNDDGSFLAFSCEVVAPALLIDSGLSHNARGQVSRNPRSQPSLPKKRDPIAD